MGKYTDDSIREMMEAYTLIFFTHDTPVPFKDHLQIHPVLVKDYYTFYSNLDVFTLDKNLDPKGIVLTNLGYLISKTKTEDPDHEMTIRKIINMFQLVFHITNGVKCIDDDVDNDTFIAYEDIFKDLKQREDKKKLALTDAETYTIFDEIRRCPKCGKYREDVIKFNEYQPGKFDFIVDGVEITEDDFDFLRKVVCYLNMPDYDDEYIDPQLKAELDEAARLENPDAVSPTLEKQESCIIASTAYTYETILNISLRHLVILLRVIDAKLHYLVYRQAQMSGFVTFKNDLIKHWIYSSDKKSKFDKLQSLDSLKEKLSGVASM